MLLDACHSGHISQEQLVHNEALAASLARGGRAGAIVFAASKGRQYSFEPGGGARALAFDAEARAALPTLGDGGHGLFTAAVLASLDAAATDTNGNGGIELSELVADVGLRVSSATGGRQTPWVARQESFGDFRIAPTSSPGHTER